MSVGVWNKNFGFTKQVVKGWIATVKGLDLADILSVSPSSQWVEDCGVL